MHLDSTSYRAAVPRRLAIGQMAGREPRPGRLPRWLQRLLAVPLAWKLAGANALIVIAALAATLAMHGSTAEDRELLLLLAIALAGSFVVNLALVLVALRPLRELESTATRVRQGDLDARVAPSQLADRGIRRVGVALNDLLDALVADRARVRRLASEVIRAGDRERARLARELHDSTAQALSAVVMQLAALKGDIHDPDLAERFEAVRAVAVDTLEEVRLLSQTVHPRVLDDLGLPAALRHLGREMERRAGVLIEVEAAPTSGLSNQVESTLYRVAQEGIANALRHGAPTEIRVRLAVDGRAATVEVTDNGAGFDAAAAASNGGGLGIFSMRERVALVDGSFELVTRPGAGTSVRATIPVGAAPPPRGS